jgi:hypothetical protein
MTPDTDPTTVARTPPAGAAPVPPAAPVPSAAPARLSARLRAILAVVLIADVRSGSGLPRRRSDWPR